MYYEGEGILQHYKFSISKLYRSSQGCGLSHARPRNSDLTPEVRFHLPRDCYIWVVLKILDPFGVYMILLHLIFRLTKMRP